MQDRKPGRKTRKPLMASRNIKLTLAYDGAAYHGWQVQGSLPTIQGLLSDAVARITGERITLNGSGRTDAGTHARGLVANFLTASRIPPPQLVRALNSVLPRDVRVLSARRMDPVFHARRDAYSKVYRYQVYLGPILPPHLAREYLHFPRPVHVSRMMQAARLFEGEHDFASFAKTHSLPSSSIRRIYRCQLRKQGYRLHLTVEGNGFLHHMVRNMAGTLLEVGAGSLGLDEFRELFDKRDRKLAGFTAPALGLILLKVRY